VSDSNKRVPVNTEAEHPLLNLIRAMDSERRTGNPSDFVPDMESAGQQSFVGSDTLPTEMSTDDRSALEAAGVKFGDEVPGDPLFQYVELPEGWSKKGTDHAMHSELLDEKGRVRAYIFYKAAFYDRRANLDLAMIQD
jgi:hypothetical protein